MTANLNEDERLCSLLKSNKIYTTHYGRRIINHIHKEITPPISYDGLPNIDNFFFEIKPLNCFR